MIVTLSGQSYNIDSIMRLLERSDKILFFAADVPYSIVASSGQYCVIDFILQLWVWFD